MKISLERSQCGRRCTGLEFCIGIFAYQLVLLSVQLNYFSEPWTILVSFEGHQCSSKVVDDFIVSVFVEYLVVRIMAIWTCDGQQCRDGTGLISETFPF